MISILLYTILQIPIFIGIWFYFTTNSDFRCVCQRLEETFPLAKSSATLVSINLSILVLFCIKFIYLYFWIPYFKIIHYTTAFFIFVWSFVHSVSHFFNISKMNIDINQSWKVSYTGFLLWGILLCTLIIALPFFRRQFFHKFIYFHTFFFILFFIFLIIHQSTCFIRTDFNKCPIPLSWIIISPFILGFLIDFLIKYIRKPIHINNVIKHNDIIEVGISLPKSFSGKTIIICCPSISIFEWHPFTVSQNILQNTKSYTDYAQNNLSIYFKIRGNWTNKLANRLGISKNIYFPVIYPKFLIYGPFNVYPKSLLKDIQNSPTIIISSGIGITTFIDIFIQLSFLNNIRHSLYILIIQKRPSDIEWLNPLLTSLYHLANINFAFTDKFENTSYTNYILGRPSFDDYLNNHFNHNIIQNTVNIYFSGKKSIYKSLLKSCKNFKCYKCYKF